MMRNAFRLAALAATLLLGTLAMTEAQAAEDPFTWMEEIEGTRALDWAKAENARSLPRLQNDPRYPGLYAEAQAIATAADRIPGVAFAGGDRLRDFWQDRTHVRGVWRETDHGNIIASTQRAAIHDEVTAMPMGDETLIGDMGLAFSGGQRGRVLLARAVYCHPKRLPIGEGKAHLDSANETIIYQTIAALGITRIVIPHRAEPDRYATRVLVIKKHFTYYQIRWCSFLRVDFHR